MTGAFTHLVFILDESATALLLGYRPTGDYSINPVSGTSLAALLALICVTLLISPISRLLPRHRILLAQLAATAAVIVIVLISKDAPGATGLWPNANLSGVYPDRMATTCLLIGFGFGFSLHGLRAPHTLLTVAAMLAALMFAALIGIEVAGKLCLMLPDKLPFYASTVAGIACTLLCAVAMWAILNRHGRPARWRRQGRCAQCGYDLRAATSNQCPECGALDSRKP